MTQVTLKNKNLQPGYLYLVATPMGHLDDITQRAISTLKTVNLIAAEDTRHSKKLLNHYGIKTRTMSLHEHNETARTHSLITRLMEGTHIALISDAGTPLISDPGYRLVNAAHKKGIKVIPIPGPCAAIAALVTSGLPTDRFVFEGFPPTRTTACKNYLETLMRESRTLIFYESVHRIVSFIDALCDVFGGNRVATIARELSKKFETIHQAPLSDLKIWLDENSEQQKGEFVVIVQGANKTIDEPIEAHQQLLKTLLTELTVKQAVSLATKITGAKRKLLYALALEIKGK